MYEFFISHNACLLIIGLLFGLLIGSFLNALIYRIPIAFYANYKKDCLDFLRANDNSAPIGQQNFNPYWLRSHCPKCLAIIPFFCNVPILGFIFLRGRCYSCGQKISWRYPLVEALTALLTVTIVWRFGFSWTSFFALVYGYFFILLSFIDLAEKILPDFVTLTLLWVALLGSIFHVFVTPVEAIVGGAFGYISLWGIALLFKLIRGKEGLGGGDFKLFAAIGTMLGWRLLPQVLLLASLMALLCGLGMMALRRHKFADPLPFGPFLAAAALISMLFGFVF